MRPSRKVSKIYYVSVLYPQRIRHAQSPISFPLTGCHDSDLAKQKQASLYPPRSTWQLRRGVPLIWINGCPGSGKLTVATALVTLHKEAIVLDNHKLIDPVEARFPRSHPGYRRERKSYRQAVLDEYVCDAAMLSRLVVFTGKVSPLIDKILLKGDYLFNQDFQSDNDRGREVATEYQDAARRAGRAFIPVYLTCDLRASLERVDNIDRVKGGTGKLTDGEVLRDLRSRCELFRFESSELTIDSTNASPSEIARETLASLSDSDGWEERV